jgi:hypothetical protein
MNPKLEDILRQTELDNILKWQKPNDKLIETIEDEKDQEPDWSEEKAPLPHAPK